MKIWDVEEVEDIFSSEPYVEDESNEYLASAAKALELIGKIIPISGQLQQEKEKWKTVDELLDRDLLGSLHQVKLDNEAKLQVQLAHLSDRLEEEKIHRSLKDKAVVGIGGKFSAGKSKFINSLLKTEGELLPEDQNPTTSIPTYIVCGEEDGIYAHTTGSGEVALDISSMQALTHKFYKKYNMGFSSFIDSLVIQSSRMPYPELAFLDTPGYSKADSFDESSSRNDLSDEHKAYEQLRSADYLIWLVDIENGVLSQSDIDFIDKLELRQPILIVVNKADKKIDSEIERITEHIRTTAEEAGIDLFGVAAYSSMRGTEWNGGNAIEEYLSLAGDNPVNKADVLRQIREIEDGIFQEMEQKMEQKKRECNELSDVIYKSANILEIRTLVEIYGQTMTDVRKMQKCQSLYAGTVKKLNRTLKTNLG